MFDVKVFLSSEKVISLENEQPSEKVRLESAKLWLEQSKLMWSRLQFVYFLHVSVLGGWFVLRTNPATLNVKWLQAGVLIVGVILSGFFIRIMRRDADYMDEFKQFSGGIVPECRTCYSLSGRASAFRIIGSLMITEIVLGLNTGLKFIPNF